MTSSCDLVSEDELLEQSMLEMIYVTHKHYKDLIDLRNWRLGSFTTIWHRPDFTEPSFYKQEFEATFTGPDLTIPTT